MACSSLVIRWNSRYADTVREREREREDRRVVPSIDYRQYQPQVPAMLVRNYVPYMWKYNICLNDRYGHARFTALNVTVGTRFGSLQLQKVPTTWVLYYHKYTQCDKLENSLSLSLSSTYVYCGQTVAYPSYY